jgi:hypothetical protein
MSRANSHGLASARRRTASIRRLVDAVRFATMRTRVFCCDSIGCPLGSVRSSMAITTLSLPDA